MFIYPGYCSVTIVAISYHGYWYHGFCYVTIVTVWIVIQFLSQVCSSCSCGSVTMAILLLFCLMAVQFKLLASLYLSRMNPPTLSSQYVFSSYCGNCSVTIQVAVFQLPWLHICDYSTTQLTLKWQELHWFITFGHSMMLFGHLKACNLLYWIVGARLVSTRSCECPRPPGLVCTHLVYKVWVCYVSSEVLWSFCCKAGQ